MAQRGVQNIRIPDPSPPASSAPLQPRAIQGDGPRPYSFIEKEEKIPWRPATGRNVRARRLHGIHQQQHIDARAEGPVYQKYKYIDPSSTEIKASAKYPVQSEQVLLYPHLSWEKENMAVAPLQAKQVKSRNFRDMSFNRI